MTKEEIKSTYSMRDIMDQYSISVNRKGFATCPFHKEKTASLRIYEKDYNCFGCGANGDIFDFVQLIDNIPFHEAFALLGGTYPDRGRRSKVEIIAAHVRIKEEYLKKQEEERLFYDWWKNRFEQVCRLLRLIDELKPRLKPFSSELIELYKMEQVNEFKYRILAFGTREDQEEMREADG